MKKSGLFFIFFVVIFFLLIDILIIETAYKAVFSYFQNIDQASYLQRATDVLSVILASLVLFTAIIIILERRDPSKTLAWLLVLIFLPIIGFILYLTFGRQIRRRRLSSKKIRQNAFIFPLDASYKESLMAISYMPPSKERLMQLVINNTDFPITLHNEVQILNNGNEIFPSMFEAMENATKHIYVETFILREDGTGNKLARLLIKKATEGLDVRLLFDGLGSRKLSAGYIQKLLDSGVDARPFFPVKLPLMQTTLNYRNHRKILVIDGKIGFLGGVNIGDEYLGLDPKVGPWRDTHLRIDGNAVHYLNQIFLQDWNFVCGIKNYTLPTADLIHSPGNKLVHITASGPDTQWASIMQVYYYAIATAEKSIFLTSPYFIPNESIQTALKTAALSGVSVKIILPGNPDHKPLLWAAMSYMDDLLDAGVEIYLYRHGFVHSKVLAIDGLISSVGSANMDQRSFSLNFEANALIFNKEITEQLETDFITDLLESEKIDYEKFKNRPIYRKIVESVARILSPLL